MWPRAVVASLLAGTAYGTYFVSSAMMELRIMGQEAIKKQKRAHQRNPTSRRSNLIKSRLKGMKLW